MIDGFKHTNHPDERLSRDSNKTRQTQNVPAQPGPRPQSMEPARRSVTGVSEPQAAQLIADQKTPRPLHDFSKKAQTSNSDKSPKKRHWLRNILIAVGILIVLTVIAAVVSYYWYQAQLKPVSSDSTKTSVAIEDGETIAKVATTLKNKGLVRNAFAFTTYAKLNNKTAVKAGECTLSPSQSVSSILDHITSGCHDFKIITFYPGGTLESSRYKAKQSSSGVDKTSVRYILEKAGYSDNEISAAFKHSYSGDLFSGKPANVSLEGYVFGQTYYVSSDATAEDVLQQAFNYMEKIVKKNDLVAKYKAQGLSLYQGITLASIVERELSCEDKPTQARKERCYGYQQGIAQVFLKRYKTGMQLGSDVTFIYAADLAGVDASVTIDSPYNTRKYTGLTPTPISSPGELALKSVANPSSADNLYFIAGDDGLIYFAKTEEEHQANIDKYCKELCGIL